MSFVWRMICRFFRYSDLVHINVCYIVQDGTCDCPCSLYRMQEQFASVFRIAGPLCTTSQEDKGPCFPVCLLAGKVEERHVWDMRKLTVSLHEHTKAPMIHDNKQLCTKRGASCFPNRPCPFCEVCLMWQTVSFSFWFSLITPWIAEQFLSFTKSPDCC